MQNYKIYLRKNHYLLKTDGKSAFPVLNIQQDFDTAQLATNET